MNTVRQRWMLLSLVLASLLSTTGWLQAADSVGRTRESFDAGWRFARFGPMPDGSTRLEPGAPFAAITASSEEARRGRVAANAVDGDPATRWCATDASPNQWLQLDLGKPVELSAVEIQWEFEMPYVFTLEGSVDGVTWEKLKEAPEGGEADGTDRVPVSATCRYIRLTINETSEGRWASVRELRCFDADRRPVDLHFDQPTITQSPAAPDFDDSQWRTLDLPHDWGIEGPFRGDLPNNTGKLPWAGIGWYRKAFTLPATDKGRRVFLDFDGAMSHPTVYVNGQKAGEWAYGYSSFRIEITDQLKFGEKNVVAVRLDNPPNSSRWYPGGGIYRHVWLVRTAPVHIAHWGVFAHTPSVAKDNATVTVQTTIENQSPSDASVTVLQTLLAPTSEREVARFQTMPVQIHAGTNQLIETQLTVRRPELWDIESPQLYTLRTALRVDGQVVDTLETPFGIRDIAWEASEGFLLNGRVVQLKGVCNHHDLGPLGTAVNSRAIERQIVLLKEMGCNAIRTSHNPPAPELLDLCDRMGMLVLDEAFDCWQRGKTRNDYAKDFDEWHERDVVNFVHRDRNHPCVIAWSSGNEIREQDSAAGHVLSRQLTALFHREDPTRLVAAGCNNPRSSENGFSDTIDIMGFNYKPHLYPVFEQHHPNQPYFGSETASCVSSRGEYYFPVDWDKSKGFYDYQVSSYDLYAPRWAMRPDIEFEAQDKYPAAAGEFVWTGFDYLGEPTPYNRDDTLALNFSSPEARKEALAEAERLGGHSPSRSSYFGILDLCGFKKDRFYLYQAKWRPDLPMVHILPHWNWPERIGKVTPVHVYTTGDEAELFLNGTSLGRKKKGAFEYRLHWDDVRYEPGELKAVAYKDGKVWAEATTRTTGPAEQVALEADRNTVRDDGRDLSFVTVRVVDRQGDLVPRSHPLIRFETSGPIAIAAVGSGDSTSQESFQASERKAFNGMCLVVLKAKAGQTGPATLTASADGLAPASLKLDISAAR